MKRILVTGGCGFIGSHIAEELTRLGYGVGVLDDLSAGTTQNIVHIDPPPDFVQADVRELERVEQAVAGVDCVFHVAALISVPESVRNPALYHDVNLTGTLTVLEACRRHEVRRLVFISSAAVYGSDPVLPKTEDMPPCPDSPYGATKLAGECYAGMYARAYGLETVCLRPFNVYGPRQDPSSEYSGVIARFMHELIRGEIPTIYGDGQQTRDFVYVQDVARAASRAMTSNGLGSGEIINVAYGSSVSVLGLLEELQQVTGRRVSPRFGPPRAGDVPHSSASVERARLLLGYEPWVPLRSGLERLLAHELEREG